MRKALLSVPIIGICCLLFFVLKRQPDRAGLSDNVEQMSRENEEEQEGYDGAEARDRFEFDRIVDRSLGYIPSERLLSTLDDLHTTRMLTDQQSALPWVERGPIYDLVGPDGNPRAGNNYTAGRVTAVFVDTLNDATGNTVFAGGVAGGLWKCTNFFSVVPNWTHIDDRFDNMAVSSITQNPASPQTMYFATGEPTSHADAIYGGGVWKSTDGGATWARLTSANGFTRNFRITCDASGNIFLGNRSSVVSGSMASGLFRSKDGGLSWQNVTPSPITASNSICTDIEISSSGRLHASFGYGGTKVQHQYTDDPANVISSTWIVSSGIRRSTTSAYRLELACQGNVLYAATVNSSNLDSTYKSVDGGATWTKQNTTAYPTGILNGQGWYNLTLAINPNNNTEFIAGGLDAYKFTASGTTTPTRMTYWVTTAPYVHADHHFMQWWKSGSESRIVIGCDGGVFYSSNGGTTFSDKNRNLAIKQFYSAAIHPDAGSNYMLAGAQDNGVHQFTNPGLSWSTEALGGDGCFVHISQSNPDIQIGTYVYNSYHVSTDGGNTWTDNDLSGDGLFVNPFDYDDGKNVLYACNAGTNNNDIIRWNDVNLHGPSAIFTVSALVRGTGTGYATAFKVSRATSDRVFVAGNNGKIVRLDNASTLTGSVTGTDISGTQLPNSYVSCINTGSSDNVLIATFSSYGASHVWYSTNGGTNWTAIGGNLPDIPVRWALIDPQNDSKVYLATEAGIYSTDAVSGSSTIWTNDVNFPLVRTDMLKLRASDNTVMASTHGRGVFTAVLPSTPEVRFASSVAAMQETTSGTSGCRSYKDYSVNVNITSAPAGDANVQYTIDAGNTAFQGVDFDLTTNGNFASPSLQHIFSSGSTAAKTLSIRVYDDAEVELIENFKIRLTVTGSTNAINGNYNIYLVTLADNDVAPSPPGAGIGVVGNSDFGDFLQPLRGNYGKSKSQYIYQASELTAAGFGPGVITSLALNVISTTSTSAYNGLTISLKSTSTANFPSTTFEDGATPVYTGNYTVADGMNTFTFSTPFVWNGTSNILVEFCYDNITAPGGTGDNVASNTTPDLRGIWNRSTTGSGCTLSAVYSNSGGTFVRPDIYLNGFRAGNPVETVLNAARTHYFGGGSGTVNFFNSNSKVIATIRSLSIFDYGCTQVAIDRAGPGALPFTTATASDLLATKTFTVTPATNNPGGQYQITLYYTAAEKNAWEAATGNSWNNIKLVKVKSRISNYSPANTTPDGPGAVEIVTPTLGTFGSDYTVSGTFSSGFSGFGVGIPGVATGVTTLDPDLSGTQLLPSLIQDAARLRLNSRRSMKIEWSVFDAAGRTVMQFTQSVNAGSNSVPLRFGKLAAGTYSMVGQSPKGRIILRFVRS
jgi:hypothetical protein